MSDQVYLLRDALMSRDARQAVSQAGSLSEIVQGTEFLTVAPRDILLSDTDVEAADQDLEALQDKLSFILVDYSLVDPIDLLASSSHHLLKRIRSLISYLAGTGVLRVLYPPYLHYVLSNEPITRLSTTQDILRVRELVSSSPFLTYWFARATGRETVLLPTHRHGITDVGIEEYMGSFLPLTALARQARQVSALRSAFEIELSNRPNEAYDSVAHDPAILIAMVDRGLLTDNDMKVIAAEAWITHDARIMSLLLHKGWITNDLLQTWSEHNRYNAISRLDMLEWNYDLSFLRWYNGNNTWEQLMRYPNEDNLIRAFELLTAWISDDTGLSLEEVTRGLLDMNNARKRADILVKMLKDYMAQGSIAKNRILAWLSAYRSSRLSETRLEYALAHRANF